MSIMIKGNNQLNDLMLLYYYHCYPGPATGLSNIYMYDIRGLDYREVYTFGQNSLRRTWLSHIQMQVLGILHN